MTNEPILNAKFMPPAPPLNKPKTEESAEIERLVQEFLAKGGGDKEKTPYDLNGGDLEDELACS